MYEEDSTIYNLLKQIYQGENSNILSSIFLVQYMYFNLFEAQQMFFLLYSELVTSS